MHRAFLLSYALLFLVGCVEQPTLRQYDLSGDREWVKIQFNVPDSIDGYESYWLYGRVLSAQLEDVIAGVTRQGLIGMQETRVYAEEGYRPYEDELDTGELILRIEDIVVVTRLKGDPLTLSKQSSPSQ